MHTGIHPTAIVSPDAKLGDGVTIGPYVVIEAPVSIGAGSRVGAHSVILPYSRVGDANRIHAHVVIGDDPQDLSFKGAETWVEIGDQNIIREGVTIHRSTDPELPTRVGSSCFLMAYSHVAHNCQVGNGVVMTNNALLAGHVEVGDQVVLGGGAAIHQFCRVGAMAMVSGLAGVLKDVLPYSVVHEAPARHYRLNTVGLRRAGIRGERYRVLENVFRELRARGTIAADHPSTLEVDYLRHWLARPSKRGLSGFVRKG